MADVSRIGDIAALVTKHSKAAIAIMLVLTLVVGAGAPMVSQSSSLDQFQTQSDESQKLDYIEENFTSGPDNTTTVQIVVRDGNVLTKNALVGTLEYERALYDNETINETLASDSAITGIANVVATASIQQEEGRELQTTLREFEQLNQTVQSERAALEQRATELNATAESLRAELTFLRQNPGASVSAAFDRVRANSSVTLTDSHYATFEQAASDLRSASSQSEVEAAYRLGTQGVLETEYAALEARSDELEAQAERLQELGDELQTQRAEFENASDASLDEQLTQLRSLNDSQVESLVTTVLAGGQNGGNGQSVFGLMPTAYDPGSATAEATMLVATQQTDSEVPAGGQVTSDAIIDGQLAMQDLGEDRDQDYLVFGGGIISHEINTSMTDSLLIVGPLAILFVLVALAVAYRDVLDIVLGLFGIGAVLAWTFGFMGWADIPFNQIMIAVPVLLIGLSIDYAIHIFMRHREERLGATDDPDRPADPRGSMRVALAGVGVALVWVTATTVIGFLSNLTSPVPPIGDFGIVSSVGILAALLVFGVLIPALKVEIDSFLESRGWDRKKRAFGTGGGRFSEVLSFGSKAARKAPAIVLVITLLVTAAGAYGATNVDTSFNQQDFLAEDPADWMKDLPEPFAPGEYTAKSNLNYVNKRFSPENSQAQVLIEGDVATDSALQRIQAARDAAAEKNVTYTLANGEPAVQGPLSTMRSVAASNETFNATFNAADTDGDGVPDRNVEAVYDALYQTAPEQAGSYLHQTDDGYSAARLVVSTQGSASGDAITEQMRDVAEVASGDGLEATATGSAILNKIVQDQLLDTVIQSLLVTLVAVFAFLMATYRITDGSATLGAVTLLPVVLSVAWILGTMYVFSIPFNVLTGMITSLTVGLGVAYSIHLSERYMQELERTDTVWNAMRTAVTGTGGALLGSAATTVGGFGVLVFAILPPLQQFGVITGLTIVYAFLASVLVLPTLLVLWTKYFGPEDANFGGDGDDPDPPADDSDESTTDAETATAAAGADTTAGADAATRTLSRTLVQPGGTITATVTVPAREGRVVLTETVRGGTVTDYDTDPEPVDTVVDDDTVYVAWRLDGDAASLSYDVSVAETAPDGSDVELSGHVLADGDERAVGGDDGAAVVSDIFERVFAQAEVADADLAEASAAFEDGELTADQYDRVVREWARERPEGR
ncbi:MMPL family transporter [Halobacterium noricense]|nr:MMPL family transporter [Halobacterium sp. CBA1132]MCG1003533.1 MMPL family transporter [Halobacterium noricense]